MSAVKKLLATPSVLIHKVLSSLKENGLRSTLSKMVGFRSRLAVYRRLRYMKTHQATPAQLAQQRETTFHTDVTFSVIVPLFNTPISFFEEMIQSVMTQSYQKWELCLADGSQEGHEELSQLCQIYATKDSRIHYKKLAKNEGIAGNTNACLQMATGNYLFLLDHDDMLAPTAMFDCMERIEQDGADFLYSDEMVFEQTLKNCKLIHFKPDFSPDTLRGHNYICHICVFSKQLLNKVGLFSQAHNGSQDYDMILRLTEQAQSIVHIPKVLYYWRSHPLSVASDVSVKPYCMESAKKAICDQLYRLGLEGKVLDSSILSTYRIRYQLVSQPLISILIPNKDHIKDLEKCLNSIYEKSTYPNFEVIIIENNSQNPETFAFYEAQTAAHANCSTVVWAGDFNYAAINNFGASFAKGDYLLLLNNDITVITPQWMEEMLMFVQREDVGVAGAKLYYPDDTVQHAGVIIGIDGTAGHAHKNYPRADGGYIHRLTLAQNLSAVTGACLLTKRSLWVQLGGMDERFAVAFNDVDYCLRVRALEQLIVFTPYAELYHDESKSRGYENTPEKLQRFEAEKKILHKQWGDTLKHCDPYYNENLTQVAEDFSIAHKGKYL